MRVLQLVSLLLPAVTPVIGAPAAMAAGRASRGAASSHGAYGVPVAGTATATGSTAARASSGTAAGSRGDSAGGLLEALSRVRFLNNGTTTKADRYSWQLIQPTAGNFYYLEPQNVTTIHNKWGCSAGPAKPPSHEQAANSMPRLAGLDASERGPTAAAGRGCFPAREGLATPAVSKR